jgi:ATP-dependent Clp protease protease subunit
MAEITTDIIDQNNIFIFMEQFENKTVKPVIEWILRKNLLPNKDRPKNLTLVVNSPGGEVAAGFALIDTMKGSKIPIHTVGLGMIASCGLMTFMAGEKGHRIITPNTIIMSHQYTSGAYGKEHELFARVKHFELVSERIMDLYRKCTNQNDTIIRKFLLPAEDVFLDAKQAVKYGVADQVKAVY